ncbi:hypothetical protein M3906_002031 [Vibrio metschnikovii]|uniref:hypothetical protein n=1 Tax=Vibrio metschnikovii TaxID=28172 RepID=UPI001C3008C5|nr:hypothetical protein [Vibrio metschnikovii]EKO3659175.1 hypothetical protein [Vibrio metschnikovii]
MIHSILNRKISFFLLFLTLHSTVSAEPIFKLLPISTSIDKNKFYSEIFTKVGFFPNRLTAVYKKEIDTFYPLESLLFIETNIPENQANTSYQIILSDNKSQCHTASERVLELSDKFVDIEIDGTRVALDKSLQLDEFKSSKDNLKYSVHNLRMIFSPLAEVKETEDYLSRCSGSISVRLEFTI